jgi:tetratricopeptide (TPR) repeat protein/mono/diheme cytochrome c family protein
MAWIAVIAWLLIVFGPAVAAAQPPPTYAADVAPIMQAHCVSCHRDGGDAPFSLDSFRDVRRRASLIAVATKRRYMPPWKPAPGIGDFIGARRLSDAQIDTLARWASTGALEGPSDAAEAPVSSGGWIDGTPDLIVELPPYTLRADGLDVFRNFVVPLPRAGRLFVRGFQFRPRSTAVHHANIRIDRTRASRRMDEADPAPGYEGIILNSAQFPDGHFLGWTPGQAAPPSSGDMVWRLDGDSDFVIQLHMRPTGKSEEIRPLLGLYLTDTPPRRTPSIIRLGRQSLDIPAGTADYRVTDSIVLPVGVELHAVQPHAHYRAVSVEVWAMPPGGERRPLLRIDDWDVAWQDQYRYAAPIALPAGTTIAMEYRFDNSAANTGNPTRPPERASWGWRSVDEMADVWLQVIAPTPADRADLQVPVERKMLTEDAIGGEAVLAREPNHVALRNDLALIYLRLGDPARAWQHFHEVTRLQPQSASAWYNEGVALEALGNRPAAAAGYSRAIELDPSYSAAHNNLGTLLVRDGKIDLAQRQYTLAIQSDPRNAEAHANLALTLADAQPDAALAEAEAALGLNPDRLPSLTPLVWLLVANVDAALRRAEAGRALAERIVAATGRQDASALDVLAAAHAALGEFDRAVRIATEALALLPPAERDRADALRARIALYRSGRPFTIPRQ